MRGRVLTALLGLFLVTAVLLLLFLTAWAEEEKEFDLQVYLTKEQAFELAFPGADHIDKDKKWLTDEQRNRIGELSMHTISENRMTWYVGIKDGKPMGYLFIDNVIGKSFPITFMVVLNVDGTVRDVEVMVYREPRGWEVRFKSFLSQFSGKKADSDYRDINSITGATLSVRSMVRGVQKAAAAYRVLFLGK